jgi:hypothetical protein
MEDARGPGRNGTNFRQSPILSCYEVPINPIIQSKTRYYSWRNTAHVKIYCSTGLIRTYHTIRCHKQDSNLNINLCETFEVLDKFFFPFTLEHASWLIFSVGMVHSFFCFCECWGKYWNWGHRLVITLSCLQRVYPPSQYAPGTVNTTWG